MSDRIVYLVNKVTKKQEGASLEFVDDAQLSEIMAQGYEQVSSMERRVAGAKAIMIVLRPSGENRGVAVRQEPQQSQMMMSVPDEFGNNRQMLPMQALAEMQRGLLNAIQGLGAAGHLGGNRSHSMPGLSIASGETVGRAFDAGQIANRRGLGEESNPFPVGSAPHTKWIQGYRSGGQAGSSVTQEALDQAYAVGYELARSLGQEDRVHCPFPAGSPLRVPWMKGFRQGGGRII